MPANLICRSFLHAFIPKIMNLPELDLKKPYYPILPSTGDKRFFGKMNFSKMDTNDFFFTSKPIKGASSFGVIPESTDIQQNYFQCHGL